MDVVKMEGRWHLRRIKRDNRRRKQPKWKKTAETWAKALSAGVYPSRADLARADRESRAYVTNTLRRVYGPKPANTGNSLMA